VKPYYQDKYATIYHGDCLELLPEMPKVDLVLTDFPYGNNTKYMSFDDSPENVKKLILSVWPLLPSRIVLTCGVGQIFWYPEATWVLCWFNKAGAGTGRWGFNCWQPILVYGKDPCLVDGLGRQQDFIEHCEASQKNGHPCPKPIRFWEKVLVRVSRKKETILDPFMGSGTTLVAAKQLNRQAIGIEIEEKYCEIAAQRLSQEVLDLA